MDICAAYPVQQRCADWLHSLPEALRPTGIVAGELLRHTPRRGNGAADWIDDGLGARQRQPVADTRRDAAARWLQAQLADGPVGSDELLAAGLEAGFDRFVLHHARRRIQAVASRDGCYGRHTVWALLSSAATG